MGLAGQPPRSCSRAVPADLGHRPAPDRIRPVLPVLPVLPGCGVASCASRPVLTGDSSRGRGGTGDPGRRCAAAVPAQGRNVRAGIGGRNALDWPRGRRPARWVTASGEVVGRA